MLGEGMTMGPLSPALKARLQARLARQGVTDADWTTLGEYLGLLERRGISPNVASFVGATTVRPDVLGFDGRKATPDEIVRRREERRGGKECGSKCRSQGVPLQ